ncbi:UDP-glucose:undecaprenyl-phosphate glucose-1-phosphate transferase [Aquicella siphonis]|uniref:UDP-glucose:undecaprenyl-phosphate glucose-1-phosphate transferase n=1 Tax=Aquicella siphonis TaxID=254247 RepID=A0A5E4PJJ2_9COXI|nr:undecaprenyl-phosphate glucose phosphotransferase [Aquicella siphonis]VVC76466.1 UDP-glucose:undecaprenyl-phosphate glucose-1-phosphate transferase [Aquicella siphonis]
MLPKGLLKEYSRVISLLTRAMDIVTVFLAGWLAFILRFNQVQIPSSYLTAIAMGLLFTSIVFSFFNIYASVRGEGFFRHIMTLVQAVCVMGLMLAGLSFFTKSGEAFSRTWFICWMGLTVFLLILFRCSLLLGLRIMRARGLNERRVVIMGAGELGSKFANTVQQALWTGFRIVAFMDDNARDKPAMVHQVPVIQTPDNLSAYLFREGIDEIWLALPLRAEARVKEILFELRHHTITTRFVLDIFGLDLLNHSITDVAGFPVLNIRSSPMTGVNRLIKAIEDRLIAAAILLLISPLLLLIAAGVKWSSRGPVFFKQQRLGWDGRIIKVYKFRTMYEHVEENGHVTQATLDDVRVTPFGRFLRRTSLDELPQFLNVLQGRMSIVGPRPHALAHNEIYKDSIHTYMQRHHVKPGITGWAQVNGWRGETDTLAKMQKRVEYDLYYINNWSLGFDLKIIFLTFFRGFVSQNAY